MTAMQTRILNYLAAREGRPWTAEDTAIVREQICRHVSPKPRAGSPDRAEIKAAEERIARCRPTLSQAEKDRRTQEIERALGCGVRSPEPSYSTSNVRR